MDATDIAEELQDTNVADDSGIQTPETSQPEKMLTASQVNELVKRAKRKGEQKMQEQLQAAQQEIEQLKAQAQQPTPVEAQQQQQQQSAVDVQAIQEQVLKGIQQKMQEEAQRREQEQLEKEVNEVAQQFFGKMAQGKEAFEDFEAVTANFDPAAFPQIVFLATQSDNTAQIIYELQKNPAKLAQLAVWAEKSPQMLQSEMAKLSQSIKVNEEAKRTATQAQDPLSRLKPSPVGTDSGLKTVRDFKSAPFLKA